MSGEFDMADRQRGTRVPSILGTIRWPVVTLLLALVSFVVFRGPLSQIISRTDTLDLGKVKLHVNVDNLKAKLPIASEEMAEILKKLDVVSVEELLQTSPEAHFCDNPNQIDRKAALRSLQLVTTMDQLPGAPINPNCKTYTSLNDKGKTVRAYLVSLVSTLISQSDSEK